MRIEKKKTAAIAAVQAFIRTEEEAAAVSVTAAEMMRSTQPAVGVIPQVIQMPAAPVNIWGINGRQAQMQLRNMMQMKAFHGGKFTG